jgi:hypothetical protein
MHRRLALRALLVVSLGAASGLGCHPETEHLPDNTVAQMECGQKVRIDAQVKAQAIADLANEKKRCEPYDVQISALNSRETLWSACCEGMAFKYIYYPEKCVVRRAAGPLTCEAVAPKPTPAE